MPFEKGNKLGVRGRPPLTPAVKKALKALQKGSPRAAERLLRLMESDDETIAVAAIKIVLAKTMPDLKHEEKTGAIAVGVVSLAADDRRVALEALRTLALPEGSSPSDAH